MPRLVEELTTDFSRGMYEDIAATRYPPNVAAQLFDARIHPDGSAERRNGSQRKHTTAIATGTGFGAVTFTDGAAVEHIVVFIGTEAWGSTDGGQNWAQLATGLRADYYSFATMRVGTTMYLFAANGDTTIKRYDGTTWDTLPNAPSGVKFIAVFNDRLYATGHSGVEIRASRIADPTDWSAPFALTLRLATHSGDLPTGMYQVGPHLLIFDEDATSYIDGFGEQTLIVATGATGFSRSVGCIAFRTIVGVGDNGVCWLSKRGIEYYVAGSQVVLLSRGVQQFLDTIDRVQLKSNPGRPTATYDQTTQQVHIAFPTTSPIRNDRTLVINLLQRGQGWLGAPSIDRYASAAAGNIQFGSTGDGYLTEDPGGLEAGADSEGFMRILSAGQAGDPITSDADGYLTTNTNDALPATLFMGPCGGRAYAVHSLGYDGFVRQQELTDRDDSLDDGTGGVAVTMTLVSRPFLFRAPRRRKRVRTIHLSAISANPAVLTARLRTRGQLDTEFSFSVPQTDFNQPRRQRKMVHAIGDAPQVEVRTTDLVRIALVGVSAEPLREPV